MSKREQAMNPNTQRYKRYKEWLDRKSPVEWKTVFGRLTHTKELLNNWWTIDDIYNLPVNTQLKSKSKTIWKLHKYWKENGTVPYRLMISRQCRMDEMMRAGRTIEELITIPSSTKLVHSKNSKKLHWQAYPELWAEWNKKHHSSVHWELARFRYYDWRTIVDACNIPKKSIRKSIKKSIEII